MRKQQLGRESAIQLRSVQLDKERIVSHAICPVDHWLARDMPKMNPPAANTAEKAFANSGYAYLRYSPLRNCRRKTLIENAWRTQRGFFNYDRCRRQKTVRRLWKNTTLIAFLLRAGVSDAWKWRWPLPSGEYFKKRQQADESRLNDETQQRHYMKLILVTVISIFRNFLLLSMLNYFYQIQKCNKSARNNETSKDWENVFVYAEMAD